MLLRRSTPGIMASRRERDIVAPRSGSHLLLEHHYRQGRQVEQQRVLLSMAGDRLCHPAAEVSLISSPVNRGVAVQQLAPISLVWNANPVFSPRHRSEIG